MWEQIQSNRRKSVMLVALIAALLIGLGFVIGEAAQPGAGILGMGIALLVWIVMSLVAYFQGDNILLAVSGAKEIEKADHPQLFNVVEEMQIAAGLPKMPRVFIIDDMALNAFATGRSAEKAAVAVTAGLLGKLNRDELQGVVAHEMSHIINRDVLLMTMTGIMLGSIVMISEVFLRTLWYGGGRSQRYRSSSSKGGGQVQAVMMVAAIVLAILAPLLAQLIYFAISRRREYLADANAAVLTRYPEGLASALSVLSADTYLLQSANKATAPMYIINPLHEPGQMALNLTSTHPPIQERIQILRTMAGGVSFKAYDSACRKISGQEGGVIPSSSLAQDKPAVARAANAEAAPQSPRQQMREAGDLLRKVNQYLFLSCACGLRIKVPPDFKKDEIECPRCHRELAVPVAQMAAMGAAAGVMTGQADAPADAVPSEAAPLVIRRKAGQWTSFKCTCGAGLNISPSYALPEIACNKCGKRITIKNE